LAPDFNLDAVKDLRAVDAQGRPTTTGAAVSLGRPENLTMLARSEVRFGPAVLAISDTALGLETEFTLRQDGSFMPALRATQYRQEMGDVERRLRLVLDLAFLVIPQLRESYYADQRWNAATRDAFVADSLENLRIRMGLV